MVLVNVSDELSNSFILVLQLRKPYANWTEAEVLELVFTDKNILIIVDLSLSITYSLTDNVSFIIHSMCD